jgi:hypothetical protein
MRITATIRLFMKKLTESIIIEIVPINKRSSPYPMKIDKFESLWVYSPPFGVNTPGAVVLSEGKIP